MLSGKQFRLKVKTLGLTMMDGNRVVVQVPAGAVVAVVSGPRPNDVRMLDVLWEGQSLVMFAEDVMERGEEISERSAPV